MSAFNAYVGRRLRELRLLRGLSQADLAGQVGVSFQQIQKYEAGVNALSFERVYRIAAVLDTSLADLYAGYEALSAAVDPTEPTSD